MTYPTIIVTADDFEPVLDVNKTNLEDFARALAAAHKKKQPGAKAAERMAPIEIGSFAGVTYRRQGRANDGFKTITVDRLIVETVAGGRKYSFELRTRKGSAEDFAPCLYAVAKGMKFLKASGQEEPAETVEKPKEKPQAKPETKPATKPEAKPEAKPETKPEPKPEAKPEAKPETKPEAKPETKPETKPKPKPKKKTDSEFELLPEE